MFIKKLLFLCLLSLLANSIYSVTYISEINYLDNEYIEVYSSGSLNLSSAKIYDENSGFNTLTKVKESKSNYYLIVGENFIDNIDISSLDCSIYSSGMSSPGKYGLKNSGESISIELEEGVNISYENNESLSFNNGESLNYDISSSKYFISNQTICLGSLDNIVESTDCSYDFEIIPKGNQYLFEEKLEYKFQTNAENFSIEYWIEDREGNIVKGKRETSNENYKTYSPDSFSNVYEVNAKLFVNDCTLTQKKELFFYSKYRTNSCQVNSSEISRDVVDSDSYIKILNKNDLLLGSNLVKYEVYRGDTLKRTVYFYFNGDKVFSFELSKFSKVKGKFEINPKDMLNNLSIIGLDGKESFYFYPPENNFSSNLSNLVLDSSKQVFLGSNYSLNLTQLSFNLMSNIDNLSGHCYVSLIRTKVSNILNISNDNFQHLTLEINNSKIKEKLSGTDFPLKLYCKYKKSHLKTYNYFSYMFNYTISGRDKKSLEVLDNQDFHNYSYDFSNDSVLSLFKENDLPHDLNFSIGEGEMFSSSNEVVIHSKNSLLRENSFFFIFFGVVMVLIMLLLKW